MQPLSRRGALLMLPVGFAVLASDTLATTLVEPVADAASEAFDAAGRIARGATPAPLDDTGSPSRVSLAGAVVKAMGGRSRVIGVSVMDRRTGIWWHYRGDSPVRAASVSKTLIVAAALRKARSGGSRLTSRQRDQARAAITLSDNAAATALYSWIGGHPAVSELAADLGMIDTAAADEAKVWGHTLTTPNDLVRMMHRLTGGSPVTHRDDDEQLLGLMGQVVDGQRWGVGTVRSSAVRIRVKNGWMRVDDPWVINSVGDVRGGGRDYVLALMQRAQPDETTGITRASRIGRAVFDALESPLR